MILKFKSYPLLKLDKTINEETIVIPGTGWSWVDDVDRVQVVELINIPFNVAGSGEKSTATALAHYENSDDHYANSYWVGVNPNQYNQISNDDCSRESTEFMMCYVWKRNSKIDLLAIGFLAEVYILNDEGKTIDRIEHPGW